MPQSDRDDREDATDVARVEQRRQQMVERQLKDRGIDDPRVLHAMSQVPREEFVHPDLKNSAYDDCPLPIGHGQTISQPFTVAFMCQALRLKDSDKILEIGTGSGYAAAVLSRVCKEVFTVERIPPLADEAKQRLERLGFRNVHVRTANGTLGWPEEAPFDGIVVTAASAGLPEVYLQQIGEGGQIVIPLGARGFDQSLFHFMRREGELIVDDLGGFVFVPLIGKYGWKDSEAHA